MELGQICLSGIRIDRPDVDSSHLNTFAYIYIYICVCMGGSKHKPLVGRFVLSGY